MTTSDLNEKYIEELRQTFHFPKHLMEQPTKERILNEIHKEIEMKLPRKKKWPLKVSAFIAVPASLALFGFTLPHVFHGIMYPDGKKVPQAPPLTKAQMEQVQDNINGIGLPYAEFVRVHQLGNFPANEIAYSTDEAAKNPNTQEIIVPYGIFVRMTPEQQKVAEQSDPNWAQNQHLTQSDVALIKEALARHASETHTSSSK